MFRFTPGVIFLFVIFIGLPAQWAKAASAASGSDKSAATTREITTDTTTEQCTHVERFVFSWPIDSSCNSTPRGGTSTGADVTPDDQPSPGWLAIHEPGLSKKEQDRRAILAMAGPYKVNFDFLEVVGFGKDFKRDRPYQSWGTEYIYVVRDEPDFISLQHIMVMRFAAKQGEVSEPIVMKHWRQDWQYEAKEFLAFDQDKHWSLRKIPKSQRNGSWVQTVYQVDDSPRYGSFGYWQHNASFSSWISQDTRRPLPRREHSVRDDYDVLEGFNRHTVTRFGWVQEEENWKLNLDDSGEPDANLPYLSKELGMARYQRIKNFDFSKGDQYMATAGKFWADVRNEFAQLIHKHRAIELKLPQGEPPLFVPLFEYADKVAQQGNYDSAAGREFVHSTLKKYTEQ